MTAASDGESRDEQAETRRSKARWLSHFRPFRIAIAGVIALSIIGAQAEAATLVFLAPAALAIAGDKAAFVGTIGSIKLDIPVPTLLWLCLAAVGVAAACTLLTAWIRARLISQWERMQRDLFIDEYLDATLPVQLKARAGEIEVQFSVYVGKGGVALSALTQLIKAAFTLTIFAVTSVVVDWRGTVLLALCGVFLVSALRPVNLRIKRLSSAMATVGLAYASQLSEISRSIRDLRVFNAKDVFRHELKSYSAKGADLQRRQMIVSALASPLYQYLGVAIVVSILALALNVPSLGVASLATIGLLVLRSVSYGQIAQSSYQTMIEAIPYFDNVDDARQLFMANRETSGSVELGPVHSLGLDGVSYSYDDGKPALSDVTASLRVGETIGIVGPSGSGKSTLAQILLRMRAPGGGSFVANGRPVRDYSLESWYRRVTFVPQQCLLLPGSVADNIRFFDESIDDDSLRVAAIAAGVLDVIEDLPDGFDTIVGPTTRDLSGGQIQRIGIARALARNADVVVLDEPTSALDHSSEALVQDALRALKGHALVIVIAHRVSTLSNCDRIVALDRGRVSATGTIGEVAAASPFFARALQMGNLDLVGGTPP